MSFSYLNSCTRKTDINVRDDYEKLGKEFCKHYYNLYDNNIEGLRSLYGEDICITFAKDKFKKFDKFLSNLSLKGIWGFTHYEIKSDSQPIGDKGILINVTGKLSINGNILKYVFNETIVLGKCENGGIYIYNTIFNLVD